MVAERVTVIITLSAVIWEGLLNSGNEAASSTAGSSKFEEAIGKIAFVYGTTFHSDELARRHERRYSTLASVLGRDGTAGDGSSVPLCSWTGGRRLGFANCS